MQDPDKFTTKEEWLEWVRSDAFILASPHNRAVFHSGAGDLNMHYAERWCDAQQKGHVTIEDLKDGETLFRAKLFDTFDADSAKEIWAEASEKYARDASGAVTCFVRRENDKGIFQEFELPALLKNESVTFINGIPREELKSIYDRDESEEHKESLSHLHDYIAKHEPKHLTNRTREDDQEAGGQEGQHEPKKEPSEAEKEEANQKAKEDLKAILTGAAAAAGVNAINERLPEPQQIKVNLNALEDAQEPRPETRRIMTINDEGEEIPIVITGLKRGESVKNLEFSLEHSRMIDQSEKGQAVTLSIQEIRESIVLEQAREQERAQEMQQQRQQEELRQQQR